MTRSIHPRPRKHCGRGWFRDPRVRWRIRADAENLFREIGNNIREDWST